MFRLPQAAFPACWPHSVAPEPSRLFYDCFSSPGSFRAWGGKVFLLQLVSGSSSITVSLTYTCISVGKTFVKLFIFLPLSTLSVYSEDSD